MKNYKLTLQYDGTKYSGWQKQGNTDNTIQGRIENVLVHMLADERHTDIKSIDMSEYEIHGSGRTDAGVHAYGQIANFKADTTKSIYDIQNYLNTYLPLDIRVTQISETAPRFHSRLNACEKHYRYTIDNKEVSDVFMRKYMTRLKADYDLNAMKKAAELLTGTHDFKSFCDNKRIKKSTVRTINKIDIKDTDGIITFDFYGDGFLYHMVRILTGTLIEIGTGKRKPDDIPEIIKSKSRADAGFTAPPQGLALVEVRY